MAKFIVEIKCIINTGRINTDPIIEWRPVHPTHGLPYRMNSKGEAIEFIKTWYPLCDIPDEIRVRQVS